MRRNIIIILIFVIGLGIFSYPIISNMLSTSAHQTVIHEYEDTVKGLDEETISDIIKKSKEHNEKLAEESIEFIDPFENGSDQSGNKSYYDALNLGEAMGTITIERINVDLPIYHGTNSGVLSKGVGHLENTSLPLGNKGEYSVVTAHRGLPTSKLFRNINKLDLKDEFKIQVLDDLMTYQVYDIETVLPDQTSWLQAEPDRSLVTLLSCEPYMINTHRLLVKGELTGTEKVKEIEEEPEEKQSYKLYIIIGILLLLLLIILFILKKKKKDEVKENEKE